MPKSLLICSVVFSLGLSYAGGVLAQDGCSLQLQSDSVDYRSRAPKAMEHKRKVEGAHFTRSVRMGIAGNTGSLMGDLDYTLRHIPNHHQALMVMINHQLSDDFSDSRGLRRDRSWASTDCYLKRARVKAPDDPAVRMLEGIYHHKTNNLSKAEDAYKEALSLTHMEKQKVEIYYNLGLLYIDKGDYESAKHYADKAYAFDYPLEGLRNKLARMK